MKIIFTSSHETYSKENTKNYTTNSYVLVFLITAIFVFFLLLKMIIFKTAMNN